MTLVIETRQDMGRVTRYLSARPELKYTTRAGDGGTLVIETEE